MTRIIALFCFGTAAVLFAASQSDAQPGKGFGGKGPGGKGPGPGAGPDVQKLERDLDRLLEQVADAKAALAKAKETGKGKKDFDFKKGFEGKKGFEEFMKKKGFDGKKGFEGKGKGDFKKGPPFGGKGPKGFEGKSEKLDPETIKERYEYYKKLFDELPKSKGKGKGKGFEGKKPEPAPMPPMPFPKSPFGKGGFTPPAATPARSVEARIDALIRELEALRNEVKGSKK